MAALSALPLQPHRAVALGIVLPFLAHLYEQEQVHAALEQRLELLARGGADRLDALAALAEHDRALAFALDQDRAVDLDAAVVPLLPALGLDRERVGQFLVQLLEE